MPVRVSHKRLVAVAEAYAEGTRRINVWNTSRSNRWERQMSFDNPRRRWSDERRIDMLDGRDRAYWAKFFGVELVDLMQAVDKVGSSAERVRQYLNRKRTRDWVVDVGRDERRRHSPITRSFPAS